MDSLIGRSARNAGRGIRRIILGLLPVMGLLGAMTATPAISEAAGIGTPDPALLGALGGSELKSSSLGKMRAQGILLQTASNSGTVTGSVGGKSVTGQVRADNAINGNAGITTVFQNSGNNALIQNSMTINVTVH